MGRELLIAFGIMGLCLVVHVTGMIFLGEELLRQLKKIESRFGSAYAAIMLLIVFSAIMVLHLGDAVIWACFYDWGGLFQDFETSLYFSMQSYSTVGYGDVLLPQKWRLLGTIEGVSGVLLCGLSAAFFFAIVNVMFRSRMQKLQRDQHKTQT